MSKGDTDLPSGTSAGRGPGAAASVRPLGRVAMLALGLNGIVGVGIFFAPREVAARVPGWAGLLVYAATALACAPIAIAYARLGARFDEDGGPYVWARAAFGPRVAFAVGWIAWVSALFSTSAVVVGLCDAATDGFGLAPAARAAIRVAVVSVLAAVVASGLRPSARAWTTVTIAKLVPLAGLGAFGLVAAAPAGVAAATAPPAAGDVYRAALVVLFALQGFEIVPVPAGRVRASGRTVPWALGGALGGAAILYVAVHAACVRALPDLGRSDQPVVMAWAAYGGAPLAAVARVGVLVSALGIALGMVAMTPWYLAAAGRPDGLGAAIGRVGRREVPARALVVTWAAVCAVVASAAFAGAIENLFALSSLFVVLQYGVSALSLGALAIARRAGLGPRDAWPVVPALVACVALGRGVRAGEALLAAGVLVAGAVVRAAVAIGAARRGPA